jgi:hypothetical protein
VAAWIVLYCLSNASHSIAFVGGIGDFRKIDLPMIQTKEF